MRSVNNDPNANVYLTEFEVEESSQKIKSIWFNIKADIETKINGKSFIDAEGVDKYIQDTVEDFASKNHLWAIACYYIDEPNKVSLDSASRRYIVFCDKDITKIEDRTDDVRFFGIVLGFNGYFFYDPKMAGFGPNTLSNNVSWGSNVQTAITRFTTNNPNTGQETLYYVSGRRIVCDNKEFVIPNQYTSYQPEYFAKQIF